MTRAGGWPIQLLKVITRSAGYDADLYKTLYIQLEPQGWAAGASRGLAIILRYYEFIEEEVGTWLQHQVARRQLSELSED
jgi:hypothetical protein